MQKRCGLVDRGGENKMYTQSMKSVEELAAFLKKPILAGVLDLGTIRLVRSSKGDAYYAVTPQGTCSCKGFSYSGSCKHIVRPLGGLSMVETIEEADKTLHKMPASYRRMVRMAREEAEAEPLSEVGDVVSTTAES